MKKWYIRILARAARRWIRRYDPFVIGITGSMGKTTSRTILAHVLGEMFPDLRISSSPKNFNSEIGLVLAIFEETSFSPGIGAIGTLLRIMRKALVESPAYDVILLEYGIDHPGDMTYLTSIVQPHMGIFTGLDKVHAAYFSSIDELLAEKMVLLEKTKETIYVPVHAHYVDSFLTDFSGDILTYTLEPDLQADIGYHEYRLVADPGYVAGMTCMLQQGSDDVVEISSNLIGHVHAGYISLSIELGMVLATRLGLGEAHELPSGLMRIEIPLQPGRCSLFDGVCGSVLLDASYNASPKSMLSTLQQAIQLRTQLFPEHDLIYCLGDMRELGDFTETEHRQLAGILGPSAEQVYLVGDAMHTYLADELQKIGMPAHKIICHTSSIELGEYLARDLPERQRCALVVAKGSQNTLWMEEVLAPLLKTPSDRHHLCRQSPWRQKKKKAYRRTIT